MGRLTADRGVRVLPADQELERLDGVRLPLDLLLLFQERVHQDRGHLSVLDALDHSLRVVGSEQRRHRGHVLRGEADVAHSPFAFPNLRISRSVFWDNGPVSLYVDDESPGGDDVILDTLERGDSDQPIFMGYTTVDPRLDYDGAPLPNSPCLDAASTTTSIPRDLLGRSRVRGSRSDIGAYEGPID